MAITHTCRLRLSIAVWLAGILLLASCAGTPASYMVYGERYHPGYDFGELQYYNGDKEMTVEVINTPFQDKKAVARDIALSMRGKNRGTRIAFTAEPGPLTPKQTKIIIAFNMRPSDDGYGYCRGYLPDETGQTGTSTAQAEAETDRLHMVMVYCKRNSFVSSVRARMPRPATINDPAFQNMLAEVTRRLLPRPHPLYDDDQREETRRLLDILGY